MLVRQGLWFGQVALIHDPKNKSHLSVAFETVLKTVRNQKL
jgi:hypothetical protein